LRIAMRLLVFSREFITAFILFLIITKFFLLFLLNGHSFEGCVSL
jgi:hypothetical protein